MSGEDVVVDGPQPEPQAEDTTVEASPSAPVVVDDVLSPAEFVEMFHPDNPSGSSGEPEYSTVSRSAFDQVWRDKGWQLRQDPYARPAEEQEPDTQAENQEAPPAQGEEGTPLAPPAQ